MGTDDLFHKKKANHLRDLARREAKRAPYERILIVCKGQKTEVNYFKELINKYRLNVANIEIVSSKRSAPINIVKYAITKAAQDFDYIYCVFDRDDHEIFQRACRKLEAQNNKKNNKAKYIAITSTPCFEVWVLLHFQYTSKPYVSNGEKTAYENLLSDLQNHLPDYRKNNQNLFMQLLPHLPTAIKNAKRLQEDNQRSCTYNPSTNIYEIV